MHLKITVLLLIFLLVLIGLSALVAIVVGLVILLTRQKNKTSDENINEDT
jgi:hypothetical protein